MYYNAPHLQKYFAVVDVEGDMEVVDFPTTAVLVLVVAVEWSKYWVGTVRLSLFSLYCCLWSNLFCRVFLTL